MTNHDASTDRAYAEARAQAVRTAAYLHHLAQTDAAARMRCLRFGINPDLPLIPQVTPQPNGRTP